jgi:hypothetical protein
MTYQSAIDCLDEDTSFDCATKAQHVRVCMQHQQEICAAARQNTTLRDIAFIAVQDHQADYQSCKRTVHAAFLNLANAQMKACQTRVRYAPRPGEKGGKQLEYARDVCIAIFLAVLHTCTRAHTLCRLLTASGRSFYSTSGFFVTFPGAMTLRTW